MIQILHEDDAMAATTGRARKEPQAADTELRLRVNVIDPPKGVLFQMQRGRSDLVPPARQSSKALQFDFAVRIGERPNGDPNFLGPFTQGPPEARFVYVNSGTLAGQPDSCWSRRAKIPLTGITWQLIEAARREGAALEADVQGRGRDGSPICASIKGINWQVEKR
jgi:hypothetical protein